ncbi:acyltransferase family protein [Methylorubrum suomiense]
MITRLVRGLSSRSAVPLVATGRAPAAPVAVGTRAAGLSNIQVLRGLAASAVLVHHTAHYAEALRGAGRPMRALDAMLGLWGVALFFAISGFLMAGLVLRDRPLAFLSHRIARIFPTYLAVVALFAGLFAALGLGFGNLTPLTLSLAPAGPRAYPSPSSGRWSSRRASMPACSSWRWPASPAGSCRWRSAGSGSWPPPS